MNKEKLQPIAVVAGKRTPWSKAFTQLADCSAVQLGTLAVNAAIAETSSRREDFSRRSIDELVLGNVAGPPDAANIARVIALSAGLSNDRIAHTVNRNCASGMESILSAWHAIQLGRASIVVCGGTESMSQIPMLVPKSAAAIWMKLARSKSLGQKLAALAKFRPHHFKPVPGIQLGLTDPVSGLNMGETAEILAKEFAVSRDEQDAFALMSHQRAVEAQQQCFLSGEIESVPNSSGVDVDKDNVRVNLFHIRRAH